MGLVRGNPDDELYRLLEKTERRLRALETARGGAVVGPVFTALNDGSPSLVPGDFRLIPLTAVEDTDGTFNAVTDAWTCPMAGYYTLMLGVRFSTMGNNARFIPAIYQNGVRVLEVPTMGSGSSDEGFFIGGIRELALNHTIQAYVRQDDGVNRTLNGTWLSVGFIRPPA